MKNMAKMMQQAQKMQEKMGKLQEDMLTLEVQGASGGGMVKVTMNGKGELRGIKIDPAIVDPQDVEVLEDLIVAAANDAKAKAEQEMQTKMAEITGGLQLPPGMKLPF